MTTKATSAATVNIRPGVSILSVLRHLNYKPWFAVAEFVDNSLQSYLEHKLALNSLQQNCVTVTVNINPEGITVRDDAGGIKGEDFPRAFRPAQIPPDTDGLSEFGMGMKSAACWFASTWSVRTGILGESIARKIEFDVDDIITDNIEDLEIKTSKKSADSHFTEIHLIDLHKKIQGKTLSKIKDHLASIYRLYLQRGELVLKFNDEPLGYKTPAILTAPRHDDPKGAPLLWRKDFALDFGLGWTANGFAAIRQKASTSESGFALFRRNRLIAGSLDEGYRPERIFGKPNSYRYQRVFGEIHLDGFEVSHTKDGFKWDEHEEVMLDCLREELKKAPLDILEQAEERRVRISFEDIKSSAEGAADRTAKVVESEAPDVINTQSGLPPISSPPPPDLPPRPISLSREMTLDLKSTTWVVNLELTSDEAIEEWLSVGQAEHRKVAKQDVRYLTIRISMVHPFMERFAGVDAEGIEGLIRIGIAMAIGEVTARDTGVKAAGTLRRIVNSLLREALAKA